MTEPNDQPVDRIAAMEAALKEPTHTVMFSCLIGQALNFEPVATLLRKLVLETWAARPKAERLVIVSVKLVRKGFEVETRAPLTDEDRVLIERVCSEYDAAV